MVYGREFGNRELSFEASGALQKASLVMRDRETDSWWSIMSSSAIGGELAGAELEELPVGEKTTWRRWLARHPETLVLSVGGREHEAVNPYDGYFASEETFRNLAVADRRLAPKTPIFSFRLGGAPYAVPHAAVEGGRLFDGPAYGKRLLFFRSPGAPMFESTRAYLVNAEAAERAAGPAELLAALDGGGVEGAIPLAGFDTFWYNWIAVNEGSELLQ